MNHPIEWHEESIKINEGYLENLEYKLEEDTKALNKARESLAVRKVQLNAAKAAGLKVYDRDVYLLKTK